MRVIFMGTPEFAVPALNEISRSGFELVAVYTREPARGGRRGLEIRKTPVHEAADALGVPVFTPRTLRDVEDQIAFRSLAADVAVVSAYGLILPVPVLEAPKLGCLNLHASLSAALARRGADPAGDHGRRQGNGRRRHAHGGRPRHRAGRITRNHPHSPRRHGRRSHEPPLHDRRPARGRRPPRARSRPIDRSSRSPPPAPVTPARSRRPRRRSTGRKPRRPSATRSMGSRPRPALFPGS